jgi:hypothetical protein
MSGLGEQAAGSPFRTGERVVVAGGYDSKPAWLAGGEGYRGVLVELQGTRALVRLDDELSLDSRELGENAWRDFGGGSKDAVGETWVAKGKWLVLSMGYVGERWEEPVRRVHVSVCDVRPVFERIPDGGGVGVWVESHATMRHI